MQKHRSAAAPASQSGSGNEGRERETFNRDAQRLANARDWNALANLMRGAIDGAGWAKPTEVRTTLLADLARIYRDRLNDIASAELQFRKLRDLVPNHPEALDFLTQRYRERATIARSTSYAPARSRPPGIRSSAWSGRAKRPGLPPISCTRPIWSSMPGSACSDSVMPRMSRPPRCRKPIAGLAAGIAWPTSRRDAPAASQARRRSCCCANWPRSIYPAWVSTIRRLRCCRASWPPGPPIRSPT